MATSYKKTTIQSYPRVGEKITRDTIYWKNLEFPITKKEYGAVTNIDFAPVEPYHYAVTSSTRVQIYSCRTNQAEKTISKFREVAYGASFRSDGKLIVAGGDEATVRLFDVSKKALLRAFRGHTAPVHVTKFTSDNLHIFSGSDDCSVKLWDIPSESEVVSYSEHQDYIRTGVASKASRDIIISGSYDHTVKLYDTRTSSSVLTVDHGYPVESVLMFPGGGVFLSAGGNFIKVWDALAGGRLLAQFSNHHKTVLSMCFSSNYQRLLSGSLDRHVKVYDVSTYKVVHTLDYPAPVMSIGVSPDDKVLAVGMVDGLLSIQHRKPEEAPVKVKKKKASYRYALRGKTYIPAKDDHVVQHKKKEQLAKYDKYFKKFDHSKALDAALDFRVRSMNPEVTVSVMLELIRRGAIKTALAGRDDKSLATVLKFIQRHISNPRFTSTLIDVASILIDIYSTQLGHSTEIDNLFVKLKQTVDQEVSYMKTLLEIIGSMDTIFAASSQYDTSETLTNGTLNEQISLVPSEAAKSL